MLFTRSAVNFRNWYKAHMARNDDPSIDISFINTIHHETGRKEKGFPYLIYGGRPNIGGFLRSSSLNVAADQQAIYELIQNADDSHATLFSVLYDENFLLCINNGSYFSESNMSAILNVGDSDKHGEDIGTFGIGFKILHRLLGEDDGLNAIINDYAGPVLFSWNNQSQLESFIDDDEDVCLGNDENETLPWLIKIIYTCFPADLNEEIRLKDYKTKGIVFTEDELITVRALVKQSVQKMDLIKKNNLNTGSVFFLKLGKGKFKFIDDNIGNLRSGISYSLNFLNNLEKIYINGDEIGKQTLTETFMGSFPQLSDAFNDIRPRNNSRDIKFTFAWYRDYKTSKSLASAPNLYNFFSMDEEKNRFRFLLHCNAFDMNNDRRKLQPDSQINERLLPEICKKFLAYFDEQESSDIEAYRATYASLILSDEPTNRNNINNYLFKFIKERLFKGIPTMEGCSDEIENIRIKKIETEISLGTIGLDHIEWLYWHEKDDDELIDAIKVNLKIEEWSVRDILINADTAKLDEWIANQSVKYYDSFLQELERMIFNAEARKRISVIRLFKFSDGNLYAIKDIKENKNLIFLTPKTIGIKAELIALNFVVSELNISELNLNFSHELSEYLKSDVEIFNEISARTEVSNKLTTSQKKGLFINFLRPDTKFSGVGEESLKKIKLFSNKAGNIKGLKELINTSLVTPPWLEQYKIIDEEYFRQLDEFLLEERGIYKTLILPNWEDIIQQPSEHKSFYESILKYFLMEEDNPPLTNQRFIPVIDKDNNESFVTSGDLFYNDKLATAKNYRLLQNSIYSLIEEYTPKYNVISFFANPPFSLKNSYLRDFKPKSTLLEPDEVRVLIEFCINSGEDFFESFYLEKKGKLIIIAPSAPNIYQVNVTRKTAKFLNETVSSDELINNKLFKILPPELSEFKNVKGVLSEEPFYDLLIDSIDINSLQNELVEVISYPEPKRRFLLGLSEFRLDISDDYTEESFEYKILDLACKELEQEEERRLFRSKIVIVTKKGPIKLLEIPVSLGEINFGGESRSLSMEKMFPDNYKNSDYLHLVVKRFEDLKLNAHQLRKLLGVSAEPDFKEICKLIPKCIENAQQLAFIIQYHNNIENLDLNTYEVTTLEDNYPLGGFSYYTRQYDFPLPGAILSQEYDGIEEIFNTFPVLIDQDANTQLLIEPYIAGDEFVCPDLNDKLDDEQKLNLILFIFSIWDKDKLSVKAIDWSKISDIETSVLLGFDPGKAIYPDAYAIAEEQLPDYLKAWVEQNESAEFFLSDLKINTSSSVIVSIRKYFKDGDAFHFPRIESEGSEDLLYNSFTWMISNQLALTKTDATEIFKRMVSIINNQRKENRGKELIIEDSFNFSKLQAESVEMCDKFYLHWKEEIDNKYSIFLYKGKLPAIIKLNEFGHYIFKEYKSDDVAISDENVIYINERKVFDLKMILTKLVADEKMSADELLKLHLSIDRNGKSAGYEVSKDQYYFLRKIEQNGDIEEILELIRLKNELGVDMFENILAVGSQAFSNDGAFFNSGNVGELIVYADLVEKFGKDRVKWTSTENPDVTVGTNEYDFEIYDETKKNILFFVDAKSTTAKKYQTDKTEVFWRNSEWKFIEEKVKSNYLVARVFNVNSECPDITYLRINKEEF